MCNFRIRMKFVFLNSLIIQCSVEFREMKPNTNVKQIKHSQLFYCKKKKLIQIQIIFVEKAYIVLADYMPPMHVCIVKYESVVTC